MIKEILLCVFTILLWGNCQHPSKVKQDPFDLDQSFEYEVPESKIAFLLPNEFSKKTIAEYQEMILASDLPDDIKKNQLSVLDNIPAKLPNLDILIDTVTLENFIWIIRSGPHVELNKASAKLAIDLYLEHRPGNNAAVVQKEEIVEKRLLTKSWYKYIKLKVKQDYLLGERYFTHYLISSREHSFGISFMNREGYDFQEYVNRIKPLD